jgi:hypothetical protein
MGITGTTAFVALRFRERSRGAMNARSAQWPATTSREIAAVFTQIHRGLSIVKFFICSPIQHRSISELSKSRPPLRRLAREAHSRNREGRLSICEVAAGLPRPFVLSWVGGPVPGTDLAQALRRLSPLDRPRSRPGSALMLLAPRVPPRRGPCSARHSARHLGGRERR